MRERRGVPGFPPAPFNLFTKHLWSGKAVTKEPHQARFRPVARNRPRLGARGQQWPGQEPGQGGQEPGARPALLDLDALGAQIA